MKYAGIEQKQAQVTTRNMIGTHTLHIFSCVFVCLLIASTMFANMFDTNIRASIGLITSRWTPKQEDFGKIKFVNYNVDNSKNKSGDGVFIVKSPFKNYYANNVTKTELEVFGLGDPIVISPITGQISEIKQKNQKYKLTISSDSVKVILSDIDFVCASTNDQIQVGQKIAISSASKVNLSILVGGEYVELLASGLNTTFFE